MDNGDAYCHLGKMMDYLLFPLKIIKNLKAHGTGPGSPLVL